jgi:amino acid adenylation domain-containing protein
MAREIYTSEDRFREEVDRCAEILHPYLGIDLRKFLYPAEDASEEDKRRVTDTIIAQPALFAVEYALARLWMSWGIMPKAMLGHSVGELVAACLAGVFSLEDALAVVATRGRLMQQVSAGGMLSVRMPEAELSRQLPAALSIAAINAPSMCVVAGPLQDIKALEARLESDGVAARRLVTSHAFHSEMMDPIIEPFAAMVANVKLSHPQLPFLSGVTGTWITGQQATDPQYWARHIRQAVRFSSAVTELLNNPNSVLLEVGPGTVLTTLARQHVDRSVARVVVPSLSDSASSQSDSMCLMSAVGSLWTAGVHPNWQAIHGNRSAQRISLPTYPFVRKRYWLEGETEERGSRAVLATGVSSPAVTGEPQAAAGETQTVRETKRVDAMSTSLVPAPTNSNDMSRVPRVRAAIAEIIEDLSGVEISSVDESTSFIEMGFDSLFLTQVAQAIQGKFGIKVTFRQLLGDESTLDALAQYLDARVPPDRCDDAVPSPVVPPAQNIQSAETVPIPAQVETAVAASAVERLMRDQLQAMSELFTKQLDAIRNAAPTVVAQTSPDASVGRSPKSAVLSADASVAAPAAPSQADEVRPHGPFRPVRKDSSADFTEAQRGSLGAFIERYNRRTGKSKDITQSVRKVLADPRVVSGFRRQWKELVYPIVTERSEGSRLWDVDGNEYIDLVNGFGSIMLGHRPQCVTNAIERQLHQGFEIGPQTALAGEVAKRFCGMTGNERMTFCNTGSEAVMAAMRVARTVTGRDKIVMFSGDYHGTFDEVLVKSFTSKSGVRQAVPIAPGIPRENLGNVVVLDYGTQESLAWIRGNAKNLAAVLVEPVQSRHPSLQPIDFLKEVREITQEAGAALIFDEIVTGFRVHQGGCQGLFGIRADLATYGKVVAGGMPIGILAGKSEFMDALDGGMWQYGDDSYPEAGVTFFAGTFVRHPLAVAATDAVLRYLEDQGPDVQERLTKKASYLVGKLDEIFAQHGIATKCENFGSIFYFGLPNEEPFAGLLYYYLRERGIHVREGFPCFLTTAHTDEDIESIVGAFRQSVAEMCSCGLFVGSRTAPSRPTVDGASRGAQVAETESVPMTEAQREIFLAAMLGDDASCAFNESFSLDLRGPLDLEAMRASVDELIARHEALRATVDPASLALKFKPELKVGIPLTDFSNLKEVERQAQYNRLLTEDARAAFDLSEGPLVRAQIVRFKEDQHTLIFTSHHIVCDGWSTNILLEDLGRIYTAKALHRTDELPRPMQFSSYARSQAVPPSDCETRDQIEAYWLSQFSDVPTPLELPLDRPRPLVKSYVGATYRTTVDTESYQTIKRQGSKLGCTLFVTLLAGFQALLHRLSGQKDIVVGIPAAGQSLLEDGNLVGHCVNFLPIRAKLAQGQTFRALLDQMREALLDAYEYQSYTYGTLVRKLAIVRDPGRLPLMEVQFNLEKVGEGAEFAGLSAGVEPNPKAAVNFDIFLNVVEHDRGLAIYCDYNTGLFEEGTIANWMELFKALIESALSEPEKTLDHFPGPSATKVSSATITEEEHQLLKAWNATSTDYPRDKSIVTVFEQQVALSPTSIAVECGDEKLSYQELNERANRLARHLQRLGVQKEEFVACCFERSTELVVAILGALKAGAAYAPLDPSVPKERLEYMLKDAGARVMLTQKRLIDRGLSKLTVPMVALDEPTGPEQCESLENLERAPGPEDLAYVIYTSGSTGTPKGVMVEQRSVIRLVKNTNYCCFGPGEVFLHFAPISFDASTFEIWGALLNGGRLVIMPPGLPSLEDLGRVIRDREITTLWLTAGLFHVMVEQRLEDLRPLRQLLAGGDVLSPWHVSQVLEKLPNLRLINGYGPTENTTFTCCHTFVRGETVRDPVPIGRPISNTRVYVLDEALRPVPVGAPGELCIAGDGLARGYLNSPELSAAKFVSHIGADGQVERVYRTGDRVSFLPDGTVQFLGRTDNQIKLRGYRIELGEIEAVLRRCPAVREAYVIAQRDGAVVRRLVAYCVLTEKVSSPEAMLQEYLRSVLPQYMRPEVFVFLDSFPLTPNGKVDRDRLPAPESAQGSRPKERVAPSTPQEELLARIVQEVLQVGDIGVTDSLFELGADSLHIFQIASRAAKAGLAITPRLILTHRTIGNVLKEFAGSEVDRPEPEPSMIKPVARQKYRVRLDIQ